MSEGVQFPYVLIPAAGASRRFGGIKQVEPINGTPMLRAIISQLMAMGLKSITVVLGANAGIVGDSLKDLDIKTIMNPNWEQGMGTTIACGVEEIVQSDPGAQSILVLLADQPHIPSTHIERLLDFAMRYPDKIVASHYEGKDSVPAVFPRPWFEALMKLDGDKGARRILRQTPDVIAVTMNSGYQDIDTKADLN